MATLQQLEADLVHLKKIKSEGALRVQDGDKRVEYRSLSEVDRATTDVEGEIAGLNDTRRTHRFASSEFLTKCHSAIVKHDDHKFHAPQHGLESTLARFRFPWAGKQQPAILSPSTGQQ